MCPHSVQCAQMPSGDHQPPPITMPKVLFPGPPNCTRGDEDAGESFTGKAGWIPGRSLPPAGWALQAGSAHPARRRCCP